MTVRLGVIGTSDHGLTMINGFRDRGAHISAVYGHKNREKLVGVNVVETVDEVFDECDAVAIITPVGTHLELSCRALKKRLPVFVEKPMVSSLREAHLLRDEVEADHTPLMVGHQFCYVDGVDTMLRQRFQCALGVWVRQPSYVKINPYWHIGVHFVSLLELLKVDVFALEVLFRHECTPGWKFFFVDDLGKLIPWSPDGDYFGAECLHFLECVEYGREPRTNVHHGVHVISILEERYGSIDSMVYF